MRSTVTNWNGVASATDLTAGVLEVLDTLGVLNLAVRIRVDQDLIYQLHRVAELRLAEGEHVNLEIVGLNLVQADPVLGNYIEVEVAYDQ
jgi:hypothetical protein